MKGKYISTSLMLAILAGGKQTNFLPVQETKAVAKDYKLIWSKRGALVPVAKQKNDLSLA